MYGCLVDGCNGKYFSKDYCSKHYMQMRLYGKILKRTIHDPNEFVVDGDICWIILYNQKCIIVARAKFDTKYYEQIKESKLKWRLNKKGYVTTVWFDEIGKRCEMMLHQAIIQLSGQIVPDDKEIDHKNGNKLDCLEDNLRICSSAQNQQNRNIRRTNTSGAKGVSWSKGSRKWASYINSEYLGLFATKKEAAKAYNDAAIKYHGEFAVLNNLQSL